MLNFTLYMVCELNLNKAVNKKKEEEEEFQMPDSSESKENPFLPAYLLRA